MAFEYYEYLVEQRSEVTAEDLYASARTVMPFENKGVIGECNEPVASKIPSLEALECSGGRLRGQQ